MITAESHPKSSTKARGTSLVDYITVEYRELVDMFGEPTIKTDEYKTDAEWHVSLREAGTDWTAPEDAFVTIYNWKDGKNYRGANGLNVEQISEWHVGAKAKASFWMLEDFIRQHRRYAKNY